MSFIFNSLPRYYKSGIPTEIATHRGHELGFAVRHGRITILKPWQTGHLNPPVLFATHDS